VPFTFALTFCLTFALIAFCFRRRTVLVRNVIVIILMRVAIRFDVRSFPLPLLFVIFLALGLGVVVVAIVALVLLPFVVVFIALTLSLTLTLALAVAVAVAWRLVFVTVPVVPSLVSGFFDEVLALLRQVVALGPQHAALPLEQFALPAVVARLEVVLGVVPVEELISDAVFEISFPTFLVEEAVVLALALVLAVVVVGLVGVVGHRHHVRRPGFVGLLAFVLFWWRPVRGDYGLWRRPIGRGYDSFWRSTIVGGGFRRTKARILLRRRGSVGRGRRGSVRVCRRLVRRDETRQG